MENQEVKETQEVKEDELSFKPEPSLIDKIKKKMVKSDSKYIISEEVAIDQVVSFLNYYGIDDDVEDVKGTLSELVRAIRRGDITIRPNDKAVPVIHQKTNNGTELVWKNPLGIARSQMSESSKEVKMYSKFYKLAGSLTGMNDIFIMNLPPQDLRIVEALALLFLVV